MELWGVKALKVECRRVWGKKGLERVRMESSGKSKIVGNFFFFVSFDLVGNEIFVVLQNNDPYIN